MQYGSAVFGEALGWSTPQHPFSTFLPEKKKYGHAIWGGKNVVLSDTLTGFVCKRGHLFFFFLSSVLPSFLLFLSFYPPLPSLCTFFLPYRPELHKSAKSMSWQLVRGHFWRCVNLKVSGGFFVAVSPGDWSIPVSSAGGKFTFIYTQRIIHASVSFQPTWCQGTDITTPDQCTSMSVYTAGFLIDSAIHTQPHETWRLRRKSLGLPQNAHHIYMCLSD